MVSRIESDFIQMKVKNKIKTKMKVMGKHVTTNLWIFYIYTTDKAWKSRARLRSTNMERCKYFCAKIHTRAWCIWYFFLPSIFNGVPYTPNALSLLGMKDSSATNKLRKGNHSLARIVAGSAYQLLLKKAEGIRFFYTKLFIPNPLNPR